MGGVGAACASSGGYAQRIRPIVASGLLAVAFGLIGLFASAVGPVSAGPDDDLANRLVSTEPADGATLSASPESLLFVFENRLGADDALTAPLACGNAAQVTGIPDVLGDRTQVLVEIPEPLPRGTCAVSWALRDGLGEQIVSGVITFSVQTAVTPESEQLDDDSVEIISESAAQSPGTAAAQSEAEGSAGGALWFGRFLSTMSIMALFGAVALIALAWPEGPEYVITIRFMRSVWMLALVGTVLFVVAFTAAAKDQSFASALSPAQWVDLAGAGWEGRAALARLVLVIASVWVVARPERIIDPASQLVAIGLPALAIVAVGFSRIEGTFALGGVVLSILHAAAGAVWFGGALMVARVVVAGPGDEDLVHAVRGFTRVSTPAIVVTVVTGALQMVRIVGGGLFSSGHGRVLLLKTLAVAAMVFIAVAARQVVAARLKRTDELSLTTADRFRRAFGIEAGIGVVVLALSGWLLALNPAQISDRADYSIERRFSDPVSGLDVTVFVTPAQVGLNGLRVEVEAPQEGISDLIVTLLPPADIAANGFAQPIPLNGAGTAVLDQAAGIPFEVPGQWTMQLSGSTPNGTLTGATTSFPVTGEATIDIVPAAPTEPPGTEPPGTEPPGTEPPGDGSQPPLVTVEIEQE